MYFNQLFNRDLGELKESGIYRVFDETHVQPNICPTVFEGAGRRGITLSLLHREDVVQRLVHALSELWPKCVLVRAVA